MLPGGIMEILRKVSTVLAVTGLMIFAPIAGAVPIIGVAVDNFTDQNVVGSTENRGVLGGNAIKYYIPLAGSDCTYGVGSCGLVSDIGNGGATLSMNLKFTPLNLAASTLFINFEDLDLINANDPSNFLESVQVFDGVGTDLTGLITNINSSYFSGDSLTQQLTVDLGTLASGTYFTTLNFKADYNSWRKGRNTPEYLIASIEQEAVPEPATLALLSLGLFGVGVAGKRKQMA